MKPQQRRKTAANRRKLSPGVGLISYPSGRVVYRYRWTDGTGKRQVATFDSPEEAESFRLHILSDPQADAVTRTMTFASWWDRWMEPRDLLPSTRKGYESLARNHILPALGDLRLCDIRASHLIRMHADMLQTKGLSDSHSGKALEQVGACLQDAVIEGILTSNPHAALPRRRRRSAGTHAEQYALTVPELLALETAMDEHWALLVPFVAETGSTRRLTWPGSAPSSCARPTGMRTRPRAARSASGSSRPSTPARSPRSPASAGPCASGKRRSWPTSPPAPRMAGQGQSMDLSNCTVAWLAASRTGPTTGCACSSSAEGSTYDPHHNWEEPLTRHSRHT